MPHPWDDVLVARAGNLSGMAIDWYQCHDNQEGIIKDLLRDPWTHMGTAEILAVISGLEIAKEIGVSHIWIECDSVAVVLLISNWKTLWLVLQQWMNLIPYLQSMKKPEGSAQVWSCFITTNPFGAMRNGGVNLAIDFCSEEPFHLNIYKLIYICALFRFLQGAVMEGSRDHIIVSLLVSALLEKLSSSEALREFGSQWSVQPALHELCEVLKKIEKLLKFAEQAQITNIVVKECLRHLRDVVYRARDILDEFIYEAHKAHKEKDLGGKVCFQHFPSNLKENGGLLRRQDIEPLINDELIKKLVKIEKELKDHYLRRSGNQKSHGITDEIDTRPKSGSLVDESCTSGRKKEQDEIKKRLLSYPDDENQKKNSVIAIVGLGGVGKTTLAQLVYNDPDVEKHFESGRAWVCVSTDFNVVRLTSAILESLTGENPNLSNLEPLQRKLVKELKGKRVLIILDDVWTEKENDWKALRVAFMAAGEGSRVIVTTRSRRVSSIMHPIYTHDLQILSDDDCWSIMERRISLDYGSIAPNLEEVGRNIAKKCKGLPLAASTLAGLLCSYSSSSSLDLTHWEEVLNSSMWDLLEESNLPAALSLSYYFLPTYLKQCFAYCSLFPKDYEFDKQRLIQLWIAEGFVRSNTTRMEDKGRQYFDDLLHRSFFRHYHRDEYIFVMHDLVHDLAEAVSGETRYLSICCTKHMFDLDKNHGHDDKRLSTFVVRNTCYSERIKPIESSFGALRYLRVLDLNGSDICMLPNDIGDLKYLHYINLTYARRIQRLPDSLCDLHNLQSLILYYTAICELPRGMKYLRNLQHLDLRYTGILSIPRGIGKLTNLKTLPYFPVSKDVVGCGIGNVIDPSDPREADLMNKKKVEIRFSWGDRGDKDVEVLESLRPHSELKGLKIFNYGGSTFPRWLMIELTSYNKLVSLTLERCTECQVLPPIGELPLLEFLHLERMNKLEEWSSSSGGEGTEFPSLLSIRITNCSELRILPQQLLSSPRLCEFHITGCPMLRMLPHAGLS
ncbi:disease resistance protein RGA2-like [Macadamia integrifolia]|uniref:disease resistance protein RGA2-like n=1 Tax=Macadamia integrifolia TaxID=60698 RepID=UPI001C4F0812|nr:disease resistance protein RGA2-like [Macadamia integrifolia]